MARELPLSVRHAAMTKHDSSKGAITCMWGV